MKKLLKFAVIGIMALGAITGCDDKDKKDPIPEIKVENETALTQTAFADNTTGASDVTFTTAGAWISTINEGNAKAVSWVSISPSSGNTAGKYTIAITLTPNATGADRTATITITCNGEDIKITVTQKATKQNGEPYEEPNEAMLVLTTSEVIYFTEATATAGGNITDAGTPAYTERGVCYATTTNPTIDGNSTKIAVDGSGTGGFMVTLTGLIPETTYYVRAYITNDNGTVYGNEVSFTTNAIPAPTFAGAGTSDNPYLISTAAQLANMAELVNTNTTNSVYGDKYYRLTADINLDVAPYNEGMGWTPIGRHYEISFKGHFDGNNHKVSGLYINRSNSDMVGLFGCIRSGTVQSLGVENATIRGRSHVGVLAGWLWDGSISNCHATGTIAGVQQVGGLVGDIMGGNISKCYTAVMITAVSGSGGNANTNFGGIAGRVRDNGKITDCYATGNIDCYSDVSGDNVGGIAGYVENGGSVTNCYATGAVSGNSGVGGVAGAIVDNITNASNCVALNPSIEGNSQNDSFGRVAGYLWNGGTITNNVAYNGMNAEGFTFTGSEIDGTSINKTAAKTQATYEGLGWKFGNNDNNPWKMGVGAYALPVLYWQTEVPATMPVHLQ